VGTTGPMGSGLPQFGFPRRFAILFCVLKWDLLPVHPPRTRSTVGSEGINRVLFYVFFLHKSIAKLHTIQYNLFRQF
jgi:hypothetical protein